MKIALIAPTEIPSRRANTIQVMKMAQALAEAGSEVRLAFPSPQKAAAIQSEELGRLYGLERFFPIQPLESRPGLRRYDYAWRAISWARSWGAEVLYTRLPQAAALSSLRGWPTILEVHDLPQGQAGPLAFKAFLRGRGARRLVVITRVLAEDLEQLYGIPQDPFTLVLPDGVDLARYAQIPSPEQARRQIPQVFNSHPPALPSGNFTAGYTGHLYAGRGIELILRLANSLPKVNFLIVGGEAEQVEHTREQAAGLSNLHLTGFIPNAELPLYQAACDVLLMPYQAQVAASSGGDIARYLSPMKLFEYMACGRAILSSNLPVLCENLNAQNAVLLPPDNLQAWRSALVRMEADPGLRDRLARQARTDAAQYSWEARARSIIARL